MEIDSFILIPGKSLFPSIHQVGGKALSLWSLWAEQFTVPSFIVLSSELFIAYQDKKHQDDIESFFKELQKIIELEFSNSTQFAIRSSAVAEDGTTHSFAGQFKTVLNVKFSSIPNAVKEVWDSVNANHVKSYLQSKKNEVNSLEMAVIIQQMIPSDYSGVAFAIDPVTGNRLKKRVAVVKGLGEQLVSGDSDAFEYEIENRSVTFLNAERHGGNSMLSDAKILEVVDLVENTTNFYSTYQDIEWAISDGKLYLLQSRPITNLNAIADRSEELFIWDNSNITESYPGITSPLTFSFIEDIYREVYKQFCRVLGVEESLIHQNESIFSMLGHIKYRVYYNLGNWYRVLSLLPGYEINAGFMEQMMGVKEKISIPIQTIPSSKNKYIRLIKMIFHVLKQWRNIDTDTQQFYSRFQQALDSVPTSSLKNQPPTQLKKAYQQLETQLITRWDTPLVNDFFAMIAFGIVVKQLEGLQLGDAKAKANTLLANEGGIISTEPSQQLQHIASQIKLNKELTQHLLTSDSPQKGLSLLKSNREIEALITRYLNQFGNRWAEELKLETITPAMQPELFIPMLKVYLTTEIKENFGALNSDKQETSQLVDSCFGWFSLKKWFFYKMLNQARKRIKGRENLRFERTRLFAKIREIFVEWGVYLFRNGLIHDARDIFYLTKEEIFRFSDGTNSDQDLKELVLKRKNEMNQVKELNLPERIQSYGNPNLFNQIQWNEETEFEGDLSGLGCSKGKVKGKVKVVHSPSEIDGLSNCILVAEKTDPGWTPLFPLAKALLIERGSLLSHAAIVARELGIPAVVSIPQLLKKIKDGMWVEMNGTTGQIRILEQEEVNEEY